MLVRRSCASLGARGERTTVGFADPVTYRMEKIRFFSLDIWRLKASLSSSSRANLRSRATSASCEGPHCPPSVSNKLFG